MAPAESPRPIVGKLSAEPYRRFITGNASLSDRWQLGEAGPVSRSQARWCALPKKAVGSRPLKLTRPIPLKSAHAGAL